MEHVGGRGSPRLARWSAVVGRRPVLVSVCETCDRRAVEHGACGRYWASNSFVPGAKGSTVLDSGVGDEVSQEHGGRWAVRASDALGAGGGARCRARCVS